MRNQRVIVVGAGPAGLAAAWELVDSGHDVTVLESDPQYVGGLARTISFDGFRFDIGAHRFYSRNPEIARWWRDRLKEDFIRIRRLTRIFYRGKFFHYPLRAPQAMWNLGILKSLACMTSYFRRRMAPIHPENSFEDWVTNRFGDRLYRIFFKTYTEKVWGMSCSQISADWASQRIKGLSLAEAVLKGFFRNPEVSAKTLIDEFEYPRLGAGMMWEKTRDDLIRRGGKIFMGRNVVRFERGGDRIIAAVTASANGSERWEADQFIVSMPLRDCVAAVNPPLDSTAVSVANQLQYRDFILVALVINRTGLFPDNWIYVHAPEVKVARIENFNNWGVDMIKTPGATCLAMEYFCNRGDSVWQMSDTEIAALAKSELEHLGLAKAIEVSKECVVRVEKAYPVYDSNYRSRVSTIRRALAQIKNLQVAGRNAMHKYNNQDHSMVTGMLAARNVQGGKFDVWRVNTDAEYLESEPEKETAGRLVPQERVPIA